jgi:KDO2-lipid IV(A) lauroyltransferase
MAAWVGRRLGDLAFVLVGGRRRVADRNLARAFPDLPIAARRRLCRRCFQHLGMMLMELAAVLVKPLERTIAQVTVEGTAQLEAVMKAHGRALVLTGHLGNWELLPAACRLTSYSLTIVARPLDSPTLDAMVTRLREKAGVELVDKRNAVRPVLRALAGGRLVGILLDQNAARHESVFVPFFGHPASTSRSIAVLALRTGAPVLPIFTWREGSGRHRVSVGAPIHIPQGSESADAIVELTRRCTEAIEEAIRRHPEQWLWMHARWRTRPPDEAGGAGATAGAPR